MEKGFFSNHEFGRFFFPLLAFIPLCLIAGYFLHSPVAAFITAIIALIPLARMLGFATREVTLQTNPSIGGLVSATFGNIIELIIAILALREGLVRVVEASIIGSIIGNILLLIGLSLLFGGIKFKHQHFNAQTAGVSSTMLIIAVVGLTLPSLYFFLSGSQEHVQTLSNAVSIVLALTYIAGLLFALKTHKELFDASDTLRVVDKQTYLTKKQAVLLLLGTTILSALVASVLVGSIESAAGTLGWSQTFVGIVVIAIITNIAEKFTAISFALENKLDVSLEIGMSSAIQVALFVVPILVAVSWIFGYGFSLAFTLFEIVALLLAVFIVNHLSSDGTCNWLEGVQLISVYCIIALAFFFVA